MRLALDLNWLRLSLALIRTCLIDVDRLSFEAVTSSPMAPRAGPPREKVRLYRRYVLEAGRLFDIPGPGGADLDLQT